jgi:hypothetical protein
MELKKLVEVIDFEDPLDVIHYLLMLLLLGNLSLGNKRNSANLDLSAGALYQMSI